MKPTLLPDPQRVRYRAGREQPIDVLLLDAQYRQTLTCMRVFTQSGLAVAAAATVSESRWAPSLHSRSCAAIATLPDLCADSDAYVGDLLALLDAMPVKMVLPAHDGSIESLRRHRADIERRCALPLASDSALSIATSKERTLALAAELGIGVPQSIHVTDVADLHDALASVGVPAVLKPVHSWASDAHGTGRRLTCELVQNEGAAVVALESMISAGGSALVQPWLRGSREAVTFFRAEGRFWARFAQVSHREWPVLGGTSVLCESIPLPGDIIESAERLVEAMDLDGCAMVEFRRDCDGRPLLMEVNPRMGATVDLAVRAGINIPRLIYRWGLGLPLEAVEDYETGRRVRSLVGDMWHLNTAFGPQPHPDLPGRGQALTTFLSDFIVRPSHLDGVSLVDPRPGLVELQELMSVHAWPRVRGWMSK